MNNFHYRNPAPVPKTEKSAKLIEQLQMITRQIQQGNKKLAQKKKLQQQFYEDNNKMKLADQIMNELLNQKPTSNNNNIQKFQQRQIQQNQNKYFTPPLQNNFRQQKVNFAVQPRMYEPQPRNDKIVNKRQLQKEKLQNKNAQQQFVIGGSSRQKDKRKLMENDVPKRISPQREPPMRDNFMGNPNLNKKKSLKQFQQVQNPFIKNQQYLKEKREQQQRNYRRVLQQQRQQQKRKKEQEKLKYKQQIQQKFNNYVPMVVGQPSPTNQIKVGIQANQVKKKRDPNAQYGFQKPSSQIRPSDYQYMKMQIDDFRNKLKKGRINHQQYQTHIKKLQTHYKCKVNQIFPQQTEAPVNKIQVQQKINNQQVRQGEQILSNNSKQLKNPYTFQQFERKQGDNSLNRNRMGVQGQNLYYNNTSVPVQSIGIRYPPVGSYSHYYPPPPMMVSQNAPQSEMQMQMMLKLFDQLKGIIKMQSQNQMSIINDKRVLQQTISKLNPFMLQNPQNPIMYTQQVPANQLPQPKQYHSEAKKVQKFDNFPKNIQGADYSYPHAGQSQISSSYIDKSLSGIVNKIPLTKKQKQQQKVVPGRDLAKFYEKKYKIKKFKGFQYKEVDNQSSFMIPSVSNYIQSKNSQSQLSQSFERDLNYYKQLANKRDLQAMKQKLKKNKQNDSPNKTEKKQQIKKEINDKKSKQKNESKLNKHQSLKTDEKQNKNPFLKKHISKQQNIAKEQKITNFRDLVRSPTPKNEQILQQMQYQTEPRKSQSPVNNPNEKIRKKREHENNINSKDEGRQYPSSKIMNIMKTNNQILSKYQMTPSRVQNSNIQSNSLSSIKQAIRAQESKDISSRQYFSGHDISPVQRRQYQSSLQTVRSEQQSAKFDRKNNMELLVAGSSNQKSSLASQYYSPIPPQHSVHASPTVQSVEIDKRQPVGRNYQYQRYRQQPNITGYSQTVQSIDQSSSKLPSFHKPPNINKKNPRSSSRKKQSVIKTGNSESFQKSGLSGIQSQGSKEKSSSLSKPTSHLQQNVSSNLQSAKFDSAIYQSAYQQSVDVRNNIRANQSKTKPTPTTFKQVLNQHPSTFERQSKKQQKIQIIKTEEQLKSQQNSSVNAGAPKWKSLQQARKLARQFRLKSGEDHNRSSVEQKLSQLESYLHTNKKDESIMGTKNKKQQPSTTNKKKDIMKILDDLGEQDYQPDFESYKQQSQR